jgi:hypothetical protein
MKLLVKTNISALKGGVQQILIGRQIWIDTENKSTSKPRHRTLVPIQTVCANRNRFIVRTTTETIYVTTIWRISGSVVRQGTNPGGRHGKSVLNGGDVRDAWNVFKLPTMVTSARRASPPAKAIGKRRVFCSLQGSQAPKSTSARVTILDRL